MLNLTIRCVNVGEYLDITEGKNYSVHHVNGNFVCIRNDRDVLCEYETKLFVGVSEDLPKYVLVEAKNKEFLQQVNELIAKGYKPQGGVVVDQQFYIQAMVLGD